MGTRRHDPDFGRLRTALMGGTPDRVPLWDRATSGFQAVYLGKKIPGVLGEIEFGLAAGYDFVRIEPPVNFTGGIEPKEGRRIGHDPDGPAREWATEGQGIITTWADFERHPWPKPEDVDYSAFELANKHLPEGMKIVAARGHVFTEVWELMGFNTFAMALTDNPDLVRAIFDKVGETVCKIISDMLEIPNVGALRFNDDLGYKKGLLVSPEVYRRYQFPWMRKAVEICRRKNVPFIFHCDGNFLKVLDDLLDLGINGLHPLDPTSVDIRDVRRKVGNRVCLLGNICQTYPLGLGTPEEVRLDALRLLRDIAPSGAYCMGSGHSVQDYVPLANFNAMVDTVFEYGYYPIHVPERVIREAEAAVERQRAGRKA